MVKIKAKKNPPNHKEPAFNYFITHHYREVETIKYKTGHPRRFRHRVIERTLPLAAALALPLVSHSYPPLHPETTLILAPVPAKKAKADMVNTAMERFEQFLLDPNDRTKQEFLRAAIKAGYDSVLQKWDHEYFPIGNIYFYYSRKVENPALDNFCSALQEMLNELEKERPDYKKLEEKYGDNVVKRMDNVRKKLAIFERVLSDDEWRAIRHQLRERFDPVQATDIYSTFGYAVTLEEFKQVTQLEEDKILEVLAFMEERGMIKNRRWKTQYGTYLEEVAERSVRQKEQMKNTFLPILKTLGIMAVAMLGFAILIITRKMIRGERMKKYNREFDRLVKFYKKKLYDLWERAENAKSLKELEKTHEEFVQLHLEMDEIDDPKIAKLTRKGLELLDVDSTKQRDRGFAIYEEAHALREKLSDQGKKLLYDALELDRKDYIRAYEYSRAYFTGKPAPRV